VKRCKGILPSNSRLMKNSYKGIPLKGIVSCMRHHPEVFKGLEQEKLQKQKEDYKTLEEHRQLARDNNLINGTIYQKFIKDNNLQQKDYSLRPWQLFDMTISEFFNRKNYRTLEEHRQLAKDNGFTQRSPFAIYVQNNNLRVEGYSSCPWDMFNISVPKFFEKEVIYKTLKEHRQLAKDNSLTTQVKFASFIQNKKLRKKGYSSCPWNMFGITAKEFLSKPNYKTLKEHKQFARDNNLDSAMFFAEYIRDNNLIQEGYSSWPWDMFNITVNKFFGRKDFKTLEEHKRLVKHNNLTSGIQYRKFIKDNDLKKRGYSFSPWQLFGITINNLLGKEEYKSIEEHQRLAKDNNLIDCKQFVEFMTGNKKLQWGGYCTCPWTMFDITGRKFFGKEEFKTLEEHRQLIKDNNLVDSNQLKKYIRDNKLEKEGYSSQPWKKFNISISKLFNRKEHKTLEEYAFLVKNNKISDGRKFTKFIQKNNLRKEGYSPYPWKIFKMTIDEFFEKPGKQTLKKHKQLIRDKNIISGRRYVRYVKKNRLNEKGYYSYPWAKFGMSIPEFFEKSKREKDLQAV